MTKLISNTTKNAIIKHTVTVTIKTGISVQ